MRGIRGQPAPAEALLCQTAAPIQLQVQTKGAVLTPGVGKQGKIFSSLLLRAWREGKQTLGRGLGK